MILFTKNDFIYINGVYDGDERKTAKKFPVWLSSLLRYGGRLFFGVQVHKTSRTYAVWERDLIYGDKKKKTGLSALNGLE